VCAAPIKLTSMSAKDCAIPTGVPGIIVTISMPRIAGGRISISCDKKLTVLLNPWPALAEPSVLNPSNSNANVDYALIKFALNNAQLYAHIDYVDIAPAPPIAISLDEASHAQQDIAGMAPDGTQKLPADLRRRQE
jgi:hypothetical protein